MRIRSIRLAAIAALLAASSVLLACPIGRLRVLIPDFSSSAVRGLELLRVDDGSGALVRAGSIHFTGLENDPVSGEVMVYRQYEPDGTPSFGPLTAPVTRDPAMPEALTLEFTFLNELPAGWFKVAAFNAAGTSGPSSGQTFVAVGVE